MTNSKIPVRGILILERVKSWFIKMVFHDKGSTFNHDVGDPIHPGIEVGKTHCLVTGQASLGGGMLFIISHQTENGTLAQFEL